MGYIQIPNGIPDFTQAVISFWFRVPAESIDKARAAYTGAAGAPLAGVVPLVVMGTRGTDDIPYHIVSKQAVFYNLQSYEARDMYNHINLIEIIGVDRLRQTFTYNPNAHIEMVETTSMDNIAALSIDGAAPPSDPVFIGVEGNKLIVSFQTNAQASVEAARFIEDSVTPGSAVGHAASTYSGPIPYPGGPHDAYPVGTIVTESDLAGNDAVVIENTTGWQPWPVQETVIVKPVVKATDISDVAYAATQIIKSDKVSVTPDHWHHVLISVDLKTIQTHGTGGAPYTDPLSQYVDSASKIYVALDDVNYTGWDLSNGWTEGDPNEVITDDAAQIAGSLPKVTRDGKPLGNPTYVLSEPEVSSSDTAFGIPATAEFVANIYSVEIAEFQMFTGVTLDLDEVRNRRAFIDGDGVPVSPLSTMDEDGNTLPPPAVALLGKAPEVLLHDAGNWARGYNTGTLGLYIDEDGNPVVIPGGQFSPTGEILPWMPDPTLHGPQARRVPMQPRLARKSVAA